VRVLAYVYPGWHPIEERDAAFYPGFTEWDLVEKSAPRFADHVQPRVPLWGRYDDRDPSAITKRVEACRAHGIDGLVYGVFWCRGKRVFEDALDLGFLGGDHAMPFATMWANRMPRRILPVPRADTPVIEADRLVPSDVADFVALIRLVATRYFTRESYIRVDGRAYFSIYDSTFFVRELGRDGARAAIARARAMLRSEGLPDMHLAAIEPNDDIIGQLREIGFDSVTHYVLLPDWKGEFLQDYAERAAISAAKWSSFAERSGLPYHPSVAPGWDASPRGADFGATHPQKYPWWPIVTGEHPDRFREAVRRACEATDELVFVASLNEWSEGHYLEPDTRFGMGWLEAVRDGRLP
jgi:hypothetical protein